MKPYQELTYAGRIRRLRQVAEVSLANYGLIGAKLALLSHTGNTLFHVDTSRGASTCGREAREVRPERFVLRVYRPGGPSAAMIESELVWLAAIRRETDLIVPEPVTGVDGSLVTEIAIAGMPESRRCVLFHWVDGRFIDAGLTPAKLEQVGAFMACLHRHAEQFLPPPWFTRPRHDWTRLFGASSVFANHSDDLLTDKESATFSTAAEKIRMDLQTLLTSPTTYGLIHADLQQTNYLFHKGDVRAIDFEDCAWGHFTFDMAITLFEVLDRPAGDAMRAAFLSGYESVRPLSPNYEDEIKLFTAVRLMKRVNYLLSSDNATLRSQAPRWIDYSVRRLSAFLQG